MPLNETYIPWKDEFPGVTSYVEWHKLKFPEAHWYLQVPKNMYGLKMGGEVTIHATLADLLDADPDYLLSLDKRFETGFYPGFVYSIGPVSVKVPD